MDVRRIRKPEDQAQSREPSEISTMRGSECVLQDRQMHVDASSRQWLADRVEGARLPVCARGVGARRPAPVLVRDREVDRFDVGSSFVGMGLLPAPPNGRMKP